MTTSSPKAQDQPRVGRRPPRLFVAFVAAGAVIASATFLLQLMLDGTAWTLGGAATPFRVFVLSHTVAREAIAAAPIALAGFLLLSDGGGVPGRRLWLRSSVGWALGLVTCFAWTASWMLFVSTGQFLDGISFRMALTNPIQMTLHAVELAPAGLVVVPVATVLIWEACRRAVRAADVWGGRRQSVVTVAGAVSLVYLAVLGEVGSRMYSADERNVTHPVGGIGTTLGGLFRQVRVDHSGPVAHLLSSVGSAAGDHDLRPGPEEEHVEWRRRRVVSVNRPQRPLNVIVLVVESLRADELAVYGSTLAVMPNVDALADESAVFLNHYATATHSNYSSVVPISSQYPLWDPLLHVFPKDPAYPPVRLYDVLKPLGYRTAIISSQNELWGGMANFLESPNLDLFLHAETFDGPKYVPSDDVGFLGWVQVFGRSGKIDDRLTVDEAIRWIDSGSEPFVAYINLQNSHVPYPVPADAATPFGPREPSFSIGFNRFPRDSAEVVRGVYRNALHYVDEQVGRLLDHLNTRNLWDSTVFVLTGDHGQAFFEHGFAAHANELFEELLRTPLIIHAPGLPASRSSELAQDVDIAPTVLGILGLDPHPGFQGLDVLSTRRTYAYALVQTPMAHQYGILSNGLKLIFDPGRDLTVLRDLTADPMELSDATSGFGEEVRELRSRLDSWRESRLRYFSSPLLQAEFFPPVPRR